jgi:hypothetical protein
MWYKNSSLVFEQLSIRNIVFKTFALNIPAYDLKMVSVAETRSQL